MELSLIKRLWCIKFEGIHDQFSKDYIDKARIFLLVDLRDFFFRFRVGGMKKKIIKKL